MERSNPLEGETALVTRSTAAQLISHSNLASPPYVHRDLRTISGSKWSLPELCEKISQISALDRLKVVASECYVSSGLIRHRYILLELRHGRNNVWMRLDRRRSLTNMLSFFCASSKGPANDTVAMSLRKKTLIDPDSKRENRQECSAKQSVTLGEMRHFLALIVRELNHYQLFDANCWLFAGAIQHYLQQKANAKIVSGRLNTSNWATKTRTRVMNALHGLYNISTTPLMVTDLRARLDACTNHPQFDDWDLFNVVNSLRKGIGALEYECTAYQQNAVATHDLGLELIDAVKVVEPEVPISLSGPLADIGVFLAESCRSLSLARPTMLVTKAFFLSMTGASDSESRLLAMQAIPIVSERRRQPEFVLRHRDLCRDLVYWSAITTELVDVIRSAYLAGIESEKRLLCDSTENCVFHLIDELKEFAEFLEDCGRKEEAADIWVESIQIARSCPCNSRCGEDLRDDAYGTYGGLFSLHKAYARLLLSLSRIEESLDQYSAAINAAPNDYSQHDLAKDHSEALLLAGRIDESYDVLAKCVQYKTSCFHNFPTPHTAYELAEKAKALSKHPCIQENYDLQLRMLSDTLSWLGRDYPNAEHEIDSSIESLKREVLWDCANVLAAGGRLEASEEAFAELVDGWRWAYEAEWDGERPIQVDKWYWVVLDMYAKVLDINGQVSASMIALKTAASLAVVAPVCVEELERLQWEVLYDEDDSQYPPELVYESEQQSEARPAALIPATNTSGRNNSAR